MDESTKHQLQALFDADRQRKEQLNAQVKEQKSLEDEFLTKFTAVRDEVIVPEMQKMADSQGWKAEVVSDDERLGEKGRIEPASVRMMIAKNVSQSFGYRWHENAFIRLICSKGTRNVLFHESTIMPGSGGMSGSTGSATLDEINPAFLEQKLAAYVAKLFTP